MDKVRSHCRAARGSREQGAPGGMLHRLALHPTHHNVPASFPKASLKALIIKKFHVRLVCHQAVVRAGQPFRAIWSIWVCSGKNIFPRSSQDQSLRLATRPKARSAHMAEVVADAQSRLGKAGGYSLCGGSCLPPGCCSVREDNDM